MDIDTLLTTSQLAEQLGVTEQTIRQWVARKKLSPFRRVGHSYLFSRETTAPPKKRAGRKPKLQLSA